MSSRLWNRSSNKREAKTGCRMKSSTTPWDWGAVSEPVPEPASAFLSVPEPVPNFCPRNITCICSWNQPCRVGSQDCPCGFLCCGAAAAAASLAHEQLNRGAVERSGPGSPLRHQSGFEVEPAPGMDDVAPAEVEFTPGRPEEGSLYALCWDIKGSRRVCRFDLVLYFDLQYCRWAISQCTTLQWSNHWVSVVWVSECFELNTAVLIGWNSVKPCEKCMLHMVLWCGIMCFYKCIFSFDEYFILHRICDVLHIVVWLWNYFEIPRT